MTAYTALAQRRPVKIISNVQNNYSRDSRRVFSGNDEHHPALVWRFCDLIKTYLFSHLLVQNIWLLSYRKKKTELALSSPELANLVTRDCTAFTAHADLQSVHAISSRGLDVTMSNYTSIGLYFRPLAR